jgi:hypothetical protein
LLFVLLRLLIPLNGIFGSVRGAAIALSFSLVCFNLAKLIYIKSKLGISPLSRQTLSIVCCGLPALLVGLLIPKLVFLPSSIYISYGIDFLLRSFCITLTYIAMLIWLKPSPDLTAYIDSIKKTRRLF